MRQMRQWLLSVTEFYAALIVNDPMLKFAGATFIALRIFCGPKGLFLSILIFLLIYQFNLYF